MRDLLPRIAREGLLDRVQKQAGIKVEADEPLGLWIYDRYGTELLFQEGDLKAWKTDRTRDQT